MASAKDAARPILLVEDNPHDEELILRALKKVGLGDDILVLRDGAEALEYFFGSGRDEPHLPGVVVLDLKMPKVGGLTVLQRLRRDQRTKAVPVVALTSSDEPRDIDALYESGVNSYVRKPVEFGEFTSAVQEVGLYWAKRNEVARPSG